LKYNDKKDKDNNGIKQTRESNNYSRDKASRNTTRFLLRKVLKMKYDENENSKNDQLTIIDD
jgi:hypothetical protein